MLLKQEIVGYLPAHVVTPGRVEEVLELDPEQKIFGLDIVILPAELEQRPLRQTILYVIVVYIITVVCPRQVHLVSSEPVASVPLHHIALRQVGEDTDHMISTLPADQTDTPRRSR